MRGSRGRGIKYQQLLSRYSIDHQDIVAFIVPSIPHFPLPHLPPSSSLFPHIPTPSLSPLPLSNPQSWFSCSTGPSCPTPILALLFTCVVVLNVVFEQLTLVVLGQRLDVSLLDLEGPQDELRALGSGISLEGKSKGRRRKRE